MAGIDQQVADLWREVEMLQGRSARLEKALLQIPGLLEGVTQGNVEAWEAFSEHLARPLSGGHRWAMFSDADLDDLAGELPRTPVLRPFLAEIEAELERRRTDG